MNKDKAMKAARYVVDASIRRQLPWQQFAEGQYSCTLGEASVDTGFHDHLNPGYIQVDEGEYENVTGPYFNIFNRDGIKILSINTANCGSYNLTLDELAEVFNSAKNITYRFDETFDAIISKIEDIKRDSETPF